MGNRAAVRSWHNLNQERELMIDPVEQLIADALTDQKVRFDHDNDQHLDFYLIDYDVYIEVKQYHSARITKQMARVDNVIVIQGMKAAKTFITLMCHNRC